MQGKDIPVTEEEPLTLPFGSLLRFRKTGVAGQPKPVAPNTGLRRKLDSIFPPLALFGPKKK